MAEIRAATHAQHEALEARAGILERIRTPRGYAILIATFALLHEIYEPQMAAYDESFRRYGISLAQRSKRALLEEDRMRIRDRFGIDVTARDFRSSALPHIDTFAAAVGWLYVFEGSTLGGMLIAQHTREALEITTSYYGAYGSGSAHMWREFGAFVRTFVDGDRTVLPEVIAAAQTAFRLMEQALTHADAPA